MEMQIIMNKAARLIMNFLAYKRITPVLIELHWLPVKARIIYKICVMTYVAMKTGKPEYLRKLLQLFELQTDIVLRHASHSNRLLEPRCNTDIGCRAFKNCAARLYNKIKNIIKNGDQT